MAVQGPRQGLGSPFLGLQGQPVELGPRGEGHGNFDPRTTELTGLPRHHFHRDHGAATYVFRAHGEAGATVGAAQGLVPREDVSIRARCRRYSPSSLTQPSLLLLFLSSRCSWRPPLGLGIEMTSWGRWKSPEAGPHRVTRPVPEEAQRLWVPFGALSAWRSQAGLSRDRGYCRIKEVSRPPGDGQGRWPGLGWEMRREVWREMACGRLWGCGRWREGAEGVCSRGRGEEQPGRGGSGGVRGRSEAPPGLAESSDVPCQPWGATGVLSRRVLS